MNKNFTYFLLSQTISQLGDWVHWVTILVFVYKSTGSGMAMASVSIALAISRLLAAPFAGVIADRYNRKKIMFLTSILQGSFVLLFLIDLVLQDLYIILTIVFIISILSSIYEPTKGSLLPMIVEKDQILKANSLLEAIMDGLWVFGPIMGGGLIAFAGIKFGFLFNSISFFISGILTLKIDVKKLKNSEVNPSKIRFNREIKDGLIYIINDKILLTFCVVDFFVILGAGGVNALMVALPKDLYNFSSETGYALLLSFTGIGWVLGSLYLYKRNDKIRQPNRKIKLWLTFGIVSSATLLLIVMTDVFFIGCIVWLFHGTFNCMENILENTVIQENVEEEIMGRVYGILGLSMETASIISMVMGGVLYDTYSIKIVFVFAGLLGLFGYVLMSSWGRIFKNWSCDKMG